MTKLDQNLSPEEQEYYLSELLGFTIDDGIIIDGSGQDFYGDDQNDSVELNTLRDIISYMCEKNYVYGKNRGETDLQLSLRNLLGIS